MNTVNVLKKIILVDKNKKAVGDLSLKKSDIINGRLRCLNCDGLGVLKTQILNDNLVILDNLLSAQELKKFEFHILENIDFKKEFLIKIEDKNGQVIASNAFEEFKNDKPTVNKLGNTNIHTDQKEDDNRNSKKGFFEEIENKINRMFEIYPESLELASKIPNSKFVKVDFENNGLYYLLGLVFDGEKTKTICYALPSKKSFPPPSHLKQFCKFIETDGSGNGFYVMEQRTSDGENIIY